ncbi:MAG: hypothetical protein IJ736_00935, partial [Firmicutes bacterium]|nr:hypothetical protein [Bacillota bacterium]
IILDKNKKYWKIESLYHVEIYVNEKIKAADFQNFLDDIAYDWEAGDPRYLTASQTSYKIKENNEKIYMVNIFREPEEIK